MLCRWLTETHGSQLRWVPKPPYSSHPPVFLLPAWSQQIVCASRQSQHALGVEQKDPRDIQVVLVVRVSYNLA